ncbi:MAG TPA: Mut7-C RNAse domain-containing protein [Candidatus Binataceae bacterium]|nr:Mut7-C RNAse domain-containing protein [Candidatus Binataceae bacterium]
MNDEFKAGCAAAPRFAADRMLGRLARWLRLLGADVLFDPALGGGGLLARARAEGRIALTRDKRLRTASDALYLEGNLLRDQLREVLARFPFHPHRAAFTRCSCCNEPLCEASREAMARRVPPFVYASQERFLRCPRCNRVYWRATHPERIRRELDAIGLADLPLPDARR